MRRYRAIPLAAAAFAAVVLAGSALAGNKISVPVSFDLTSATCSQLPAGTTIHGDGTGQFSMTGSGIFHSEIKGTATDGAGNSWKFNYNQNARLLDAAGDVQIVDHFNLVGNGGVLHLHSHFVAIFSSTGDLLDLKQLTGDPEGCDPI
jgi:hypothetical protein